MNMLLAVVVFSALSVAQADRFSVYVAAPTRDGFVDTSKPVQDSIKDIKGRLTGIKELRIVEKREEADIVLTVTARGVGSESYGQRLTLREHYSNAVLTSEPILATTWWVASVLEVGDYRKEVVGVYAHPPGLAYYGGAWKECASRLATDVKVWAIANAAQLKQRRGQKYDGAPTGSVGLVR